MVEEMNNEMTTFESRSEGDVVTGTITKVEDKHALVDAGYKVEGILPISELSSLHVEKMEDVVHQDDELQLKVIKVTDEELVLSKKEVDADKAWDNLEDKYDHHETISVEVADVVKGGLVADLGVRGFIPASLVDRQYVEDFSEYKGATLDVKIIELDRENRKVILSHRAVQDEEANKEKEDILGRIESGRVYEGTVQRLTDFGAFVDIGGVDGLVHISQLAHQHVEHPSDVVQEGASVKVKVLSVDRDNERISLSVKATQPGPWERAAEQLDVGDVVEGTVKRLVPFGAFVELIPGVEGLVHISEISNRHIGTPDEVLEEGENVKVKVLDVNASEKRVSLSIRELEDQSANEQPAIQYEDEDNNGFSLGDVIGDQLKKLK
ncbi:30S ribosomal protein S1 [Tuberibacillus sp. Marseille-P3662]|uniref:30S ribosomal protein S1 n=1 Tax=Tuberibacillus sp. Marseille-P3662 TaxID=1965358 RepID=UPI000A1C8E69|nr:30S ribosomal protein S1 [Tuberibacillus sp. Marseille-P3662]